MIADRYQLLDRIGDGGMATVYRARQRGVGGFDRIVAIKKIAPHLAANPEYVERFTHEASIASALSHPAIVQIYDFGRDGDGFYIAMEHVEGRSLLAIASDAAREGVAIPVDVVVAILTEVADALDHIHSRTRIDGVPLDIIHRDVSLANVLVTRAGHVKLIDFGVATGRGFTTPSHGAVVGKPSYMAPEMIRARAIDARADLYALGVIGWELLAGYPLFFADDVPATFQRVLHDDVPALMQVRPDCPPELETVIHCALARDRELRPASAQVLRSRLEATARSAGVATGAAVIARWLATQPAPSPELTIDVSTINLPRRQVAPAATPAPLAPLATPPRRNMGRSRLRIAAIAAVTVAIGLLAIGVDHRSSSASASAAARPSRAAVAAAPIVRPIVEPIIEPRPPVATVTVRAEPSSRTSHPAPSKRGVARAGAARDAKAPTFDAPTLPVPMPPLVPPIIEPPPPMNTVLVHVEARRTPLLIRPDRVTKLAGDIAPLPRAATEHLTIVSALICIDERGAVTSAKLIGEVPGQIRDPITRDLSGFVFSPYRADGAATPVCFTRQLPVGSPHR